MRQTSISLSSQLISVCSTCRVTLVPKTSYADEAFGKEEEYGAVWFVPKCATLCLRLVVQIEKLTLGRKVRQSVAT
jgi:hypothetical protein